MKFSNISLWPLSILIGVLFVNSCTQRSNQSGGSSGDAQTKDSLSAPSTDSAEHDKPLQNVQDIQRAYAGIIKKLENGALDSASFKYSCYNEKGGTVSYYSEKGRLRMIEHRYNEYDHFSATDRYFVKDSTLFFAYLNSVTWAFESGPEGSTKDNITEQRVYLINQQPIKCLEKKFVIHSQAADNPRSETVVSKEVECAKIESVIKPYNLLIGYRNNAPSGCPEEI